VLFGEPCPKAGAALGYPFGGQKPCLILYRPAAEERLREPAPPVPFLYDGSALWSEESARLIELLSPCSSGNVCQIGNCGLPGHRGWRGRCRGLSTMGCTLRFRPQTGGYDRVERAVCFSAPELEAPLSQMAMELRAPTQALACGAVSHLSR